MVGHPVGFTSARPITFPCTLVQMVPTSQVIANDYNPNHVATPELELLEQSIRRDGVTQPIVVVYDESMDRYIVIDGFHRLTVLRQLGCESVPVVVLERTIQQRMAATVRHNEARGDHRLDLMVALVHALQAAGWDRAQIAEHMGMEEEEIMRLIAMRGGAA